MNWTGVRSGLWVSVLLGSSLMDGPKIALVSNLFEPTWFIRELSLVRALVRTSPPAPDPAMPPQPCKTLTELEGEAVM